MGWGVMAPWLAVAEQSLPPVTVTADPLASWTAPAVGHGGAGSDRVGASRTVIDQEQLTTRSPQRLEELSGRIPGAHVGRAHGGLGTALTLRGFDTTVPQWNGLRDIDRLFVRDPYTVDQIEIVRGPDAVLEGVTAPGGAVRYRGRRPQHRSAHEVGLEAGYPDHRRVTADSTGGLGEDWAYRLTFAGQDGESRPAELSTERVHGLAGLAWAYHPDGELRLEYEAQRNRRPFDFGTAVVDGVGPVLDTPLHSPEQESDRRYRRAALYWEHVWDGGWRLTARAARAEVEREDFLLGFVSGGVPADEPMAGWGYDVEDDYTQHDARIQVEYDGAVAGQPLRSVIGVDRQQDETDMARDSLSGFQIDPLEPDFTGIDPADLNRQDSSVREERKQHGVYFAQHAEIGAAWEAGFGLRYNTYEIRREDRHNPVFGVVAEDSGWTGQLGLRARVTDRAALHWSLGRGFQPNEGTDRHGDYLPSRESRIVEAGWTYRPEQRQQVAVSVFHLAQTNLPREDRSTPDPEDLTAAGEKRVTGLELRHQWGSAAWRVEPHATVQRSRRYDDPEYRNHHFEGIPEHLAGVELEHNFGAYTPLALRLWYSGQYVGGWYLDDANQYRTDAYVLHELGAVYELTEDSRWDLRVLNATDERYLAAPRVQGERRQIRVGLTQRF